MSAHEKAGPTPGTGNPLNTSADSDHTPDLADALAAVTGYALAVETGKVVPLRVV